MTGLLETFLRSTDESNLRGELDAAAWRFVLPGEVETVEWRRTGSIAQRDLHALQRHTTVFRPTAGQAAVVGPNGRRVDLVVGADPSVDDGDGDGDDRAPLGIDLDDGGRLGQRLELRYEGDELRGVAPVADSTARSVLDRHVGADGPVPRSWKQHLRREPARVRRTVSGSLRGAAAGPPAWLVAAAAVAGLDISQFGWALWCRGDYGSQKLVIFLIAPGDSEPSVVVKITRDARFNTRLDSESRMLREMARLAPTAMEGAPRLLFQTTVWGSAVSAQSAVLGSDLREHVRARPELVDRVTTWMIEMANETRTPTRAGELEECLHGLLDRYRDLYDVPTDVERFLRDQAGRLGVSDLRAVMQHGDPGPWNAVVTSDGTVAFLDWEAGELRGLPLWDLFYFLRSVSLIVSPHRPWQSRRARTRRDLVRGSAVGDVFAEHVRAYVDAVEIDPTLVEPLFHLCWVHRAVKQANRLSPSRRSTGTFHRLVIDGVERRDQPGLRRITMRTDPGGRAP